MIVRSGRSLPDIEGNHYSIKHCRKLSIVNLSSSVIWSHELFVLYSSSCDSSGTVAVTEVSTDVEENFPKSAVESKFKDI